MRAPLVIELYAGTFGWSHGWLARGGHAVGFDIEHQPWHGPVPDGAELVLQDVRTLHGSQFRHADLILASPPCQEFSWRAMPWTKAKQAPPPHLGMELFSVCFRLQREASEEAGRHIPMVIENVRGAQRWVGRARWHHGSYYLWGDVPALMPIPVRATKSTGLSWSNRELRGQDFTRVAARQLVEGRKNSGDSWFAVAHNTTSGVGANPVHSRRNDPHDGVKCGGDWFGKESRSPMRRAHSQSSARRAASALIARIPAPLSDWVAHVYWPGAAPAADGAA